MREHEHADTRAVRHYLFFPLIMPAKDLRRYRNSTFFQTVAFFFKLKMRAIEKLMGSFKAHVCTVRKVRIISFSLQFRVDSASEK